jgi:hypothetical protein
MNLKQKFLRFLVALSILVCLAVGYLARPTSPFIRDPYCSDSPCPQYVERNYRLLSPRKWGFGHRITRTEGERDNSIIYLGIFSVIDTAHDVTSDELNRLHISGKEISNLHQKQLHINVPRL